MRAIAIMNNKGGVGKTVTALNLADILANDYKQRVVLLDCDGQANLTGFFLPGQDMDSVTTAAVRTGFYPAAPACTIWISAPSRTAWARQSG